MFARWSLGVLTVLMVWLSLELTASSVRGDEFAGRWQGRWTTESEQGRRGHQGSVRMNLRPNGDGTYRGLFVGRFAVVIPYVYRAPVYRQGETLVSRKQLGPFGNYDMILWPTGPANVSGQWSAAGSRGGLQLRRR